jgi:hypothetical protein
VPKWHPEVRIISDGTSFGTTVEVNGKTLTCVTKIEWSVDINNHATAKLEVDMPMLEVTGELTSLELKELLHEANDR